MSLAESLGVMLSKIRSRGWNLYECNERQRLPDFVSRGPSETLEDGKSYAVLPSVDDPKSVDAIAAACGDSSIIPIMLHAGRAIPIVYFTVHAHGIAVHAETELVMPYTMALRALDTLASAKTDA